jgi:segregation and condensation protein A
VVDFRIDLDMFRGPLDLLLFLVRKHEMEIVDIRIATITEQYMNYLAVLEQLDVNSVADFLATASMLIEIKSQQVLPRCDEVQEEIEDPRQDLVRRLLDYKKYRDAASLLEDRSIAWQQRYPRLANEVPVHERDLADEPIQEVELWDLVSAFGRIIRETEAARPSNIVYDDTPIRVHMARIHARLIHEGRLAFCDLFEPTMHKSKLLGIFLAILELVRHHHIRVEQNGLFGEIWVYPDPDCKEPLDLSGVDEYENKPETATA